MSETAELKATPPKWPVSVAELRKAFGQKQSEELSVRLAPYDVISTHVADDPVTASIDLESVQGGVRARGTVSFSWEGDCRRCLEPTTGTMTVDVDELYQVDADPDSDYIDFDGDHLDLLPIVVEAAVLSLPLAPLCSTDCAGPDPDRYPTKTFEELEAERKAKPDPRWAGLDGLDLES